MADLILSPIADNIIGSLGSVAVQQIATIWGVKDDLKQLQNTISIIKAVLLDAEKKQIHNHGVRIWLKSLGEAVHEADDLMDEFNTEALRRQVMGGNGLSKQVFTFFSSSNQIAFRHKIGRRIRGIKKKLDMASKDRIFLLLEARSHDKESGVVRRRETHSFVSQDEVIGRDNDRNEIVKLLLESQFEKNVTVIPIVGMGGLGKTTLAQSVFNDERVQQHFEHKVWVCVSDHFDLKLILQTITNTEKVRLDQLQDELRKQLGGKLYLLVLDDVWEENRGKWLELEKLLMCGEKGSWILVTTRSKKVAGVTSVIGPYELGVLDEEKSWSLFEKMAFKQGHEEKDPNLVKIGMEIVSRCGGIPLAIRTIGGMLYFKNLESEWTSLNKEFSKIPQTEDDVLPTLRLSYDNLTSHLKRCFAYCNLFPKGYHIQVPILIQLWMAQGLLDSSNDECLEDVGYRYFEDLLLRSFFQEIELDKFGAVKSCKMHDLIYDLAKEAAGQEYAIVNSNSLGNVNVNARHLSFDINFYSAEQIPTSLFEARKIRTILLLQQNIWEDKEDKLIMGAIIAKFKQIRILELNGTGISIIPDSINKLKFVRYLNLSHNTKIKNIPDSITDLLNLHSLKLGGCSELQQLPRDMKKLVNLRHLDILGCDNLTHMPIGFSHLTNLVTLSNYVLPKSNGFVPKHSGELKELLTLKNLRGELVISNLKHGKGVEEELEYANLKEKRHLVSLYLKWDETIEAEEKSNEMSLEQLKPHSNLKQLRLQRYGGLNVPCWLQSLTSLVSLSLDGCNNWKHLTPMGQFSNLKKLQLKNLLSLEYITISYKVDNFFSSLTLLPSLHQLELSYLPNLKGWWGEFEENQPKKFPCLPQLSNLYVLQCPKFTCMPLYPHLVEYLHLSNTSWKSFQQTLILETTSFSPLSKLKSLQLKGIEDMEFFPDCFKSLTSLQSLELSSCSKLKDVCPGILYLTSLKNLEIRKCDGLVDAMHNEIMWKVLTSTLEIMYIGGFEQMVCLPDGIRHLTSLQSLKIWKCDGLTTIPEWIGNLLSLKRISLNSCKNLISLPEAIQNLTSLERLEIKYCPMLLKRCRTEKGEDWHKISHIPYLYL